MKFNSLLLMTDEDYEIHEALRLKYYYFNHHNDPDAPYWGDGPNVGTEDNYEDGDYNSYYDTLLSPEEHEYMEDCILKSEGFFSAIAKNDWKRIADEHNISLDILKWLNERNLPYIHYVHPVYYREYIFLKNEVDIALFYVKTMRRLDTSIVRNVTDKWCKVSREIDGDFNVLEWLKNNCKGLYIVHSRQPLGFANNKYIFDMSFEYNTDAVHLKMVLE